MSIFDFITNDGFRVSLDSDYRELENCLNSKSWKAVHVLAGSIIEAVILDFLITDQNIPEEKAFKLDLSSAINLCQEKKFFQQELSISQP